MNIEKILVYTVANVSAIILFLAVGAATMNSVRAVEVEPTYNNPTTFEEKKKEEADAEPECD